MDDAEILIVAGEQAIREMLVYSLERAGFPVSQADSAEVARSRIAERRPGLALIDWDLHDDGGLELARGIKSDKECGDIPVILLMSYVTEGNKAAALESGADAYVTKPFSIKELITRIQVILRRAERGDAASVIELYGLKLDESHRRVTSGDVIVPLGPTEYRLLALLMSHAERVYSRRQLLRVVWGSTDGIRERTIDVHIRRLRDVLEEFGHGHLIQTVRGLGYRFSNLSHG